MTGPEGYGENLNVSRDEVEGLNWDSRETKFTVSQATSHEVICYIAKQKTKANFEKRDKIPATSGHLQLHALITCNSGQHFAVSCVTSMLPAHGIWRETVSLLDVMWLWTSQWMDALGQEKRQLYNKVHYLFYNIVISIIIVIIIVIIIIAYFLTYRLTKTKAGAYE